MNLRTVLCAALLSAAATGQAQAAGATSSGLFPYDPNGTAPHFICACVDRFEVDLGTITFTVETDTLPSVPAATEPPFNSAYVEPTPYIDIGTIWSTPPLDGATAGSTITPVPEPDSYLMLGAGLLLVAALRQRHRQQ